MIKIHTPASVKESEEALERLAKAKPVGKTKADKIMGRKPRRCAFCGKKVTAPCESASQKCPNKKG